MRYLLLVLSVLLAQNQCTQTMESKNIFARLWGNIKSYFFPQEAYMQQVGKTIIEQKLQKKITEYIAKNNADIKTMADKKLYFIRMMQILNAAPDLTPEEKNILNSYSINDPLIAQALANVSTGLLGGQSNLDTALALPFQFEQEKIKAYATYMAKNPFHKQDLGRYLKEAQSDIQNNRPYLHKVLSDFKTLGLTIEEAALAKQQASNIQEEYKNLTRQAVKNLISLAPEKKADFIANYVTTIAGKQKIPEARQIIWNSTLTKQANEEFMQSPYKQELDQVIESARKILSADSNEKLLNALQEIETIKKNPPFSDDYKENVLAILNTTDKNFYKQIQFQYNDDLNQIANITFDRFITMQDLEGVSSSVTRRFTEGGITYLLTEGPKVLQEKTKGLFSKILSYFTAQPEALSWQQEIKQKAEHDFNLIQDSNEKILKWLSANSSAIGENLARIDTFSIDALQQIYKNMLTFALVLEMIAQHNKIEISIKINMEKTPDPNKLTEATKQQYINLLKSVIPALQKDVKSIKNKLQPLAIESLELHAQSSKKPEA